MTYHWMIAQSGLTALRNADHRLAARFFNRNTSFVIGYPPKDWATVPVTSFRSYLAYRDSPFAAAGWVLYDPEQWKDKVPPPTPLIEQEHPAAFIPAFTSLANERRQKVIAAPSRDLMLCASADYGIHTAGEPIDVAFLKARIPAACAGASVYHLQNQANQDDLPAFQSLLDGASEQLPAGFPMWCGLTTMRDDTAAEMLAAFTAAKNRAAGFWLNTNAETIALAVQFLTAVSTP
jgi:hypothetical protein